MTTITSSNVTAALSYSINASSELIVDMLSILFQLAARVQTDSKRALMRIVAIQTVRSRLP